MVKVFIICGLSGSGKTTLAKELSRTLNNPCFHKDSIKEALYEAMEMSTLEESKQLGAYSIRLLIALAEEQIENGIDVIIEAPFRFEEDYPIFQKWIDDFGISLYSVVCELPAEDRKERFFNRPRHHAHHDNEREYKDEDPTVYNKLPGKMIRITTDKPVEQLAKEIIDSVKNT